MKDGNGKAGNQPAYIRVEGGIISGWIPKDEWDKRYKPDPRNGVRVDQHHILLQLRG